jgi:hypothetical protein
MSIAMVTMREVKALRVHTVAAASVAAFLAVATSQADAAECAGASCASAKQGQGIAVLAEPPAGSIDIRDRRSGDLYRVCLAEQGDSSGWCSAYLMGIADTLAAFGDGGNGSGICNANYTIESLAETFMTWARANDTLQRLDMLAGAGLAFRQRWPCRR